MEGWSGGRGSSWSYRQETVGSNVSSSSGTIVSNLSTAYASSGSRLSTLSMEAVMHFDSFGIHGNVNGNNVDDRKEAEEEEAEKEETEEERIRNLVQEFFGAPSVNCSIKRGRGNMSVVERWLTEMRVGWVLSLDDDGASAAAGEDLDRDPRTWTRALYEIVQSICFRRPLFPDRGSVDLPSICEEQGERVAERCIPDQYHFVLFIQETMLKMLTFVDVVVAWDPDTIEFLSMDGVMYNKLFNLLGAHDALSEASNRIGRQFDSPTSVEVDRIENEMVILLSAYKSKASEAIRRTMEKIRTRSMEDGDDSPSPLNPQGSSDIHKVTRSVMTYIDLLQNSRLLVNAAIQGHVPDHSVDSMVVEMISSLKEKLVDISESFSDQGLKFLFLLNNSYNIQQSLQFDYHPGPVLLADNLTHKIKGYMERYLQVSWAPLLSCLFNPTPLCLGKNSSLLSKFESEFQKIYSTQKQWKLPDPWLRRRLREVITNKIILGYTEYIEVNKVTKPKISLQELKEMLQELFEG